MLENLKPVSNNNSLRQVTSSVFSNTPLINPSRFEKYIDELNGYQKFEVIKKNAFNIQIKNSNINSNNLTSKEVEVGFRIVGFEEGRTNKLLIAQENNINNGKLSVYNYQSLKYPTWNNFKLGFLNDFRIISIEDNPFINAISLNYLNEFYWDSNDDIVIDEIFNKDADFLPKKFFNSQNSSFLINTEDYKDTFKSIEKIEIVVSKHKKTIQINSQLVFELIDPIKFNDSIVNNKLSEYFEDIHSEIKNTLNFLFTEEVKTKINFK